MSDIPSHLGPAREFKARKRAAVRAALREVEELLVGCVWTPAYEEIVIAREMLERAKALLAVKNWRR